MSNESTNKSCSGECSSCAESGRCPDQALEKIKMAAGSSARRVIGVISGKGGVGKSFTAAYLAVLLRRAGYKVGVLDADVTGASIPYAFGLTAKALGSEAGIFPAVTRTGIKIISSNMLLEDDGDPIIWRGPMIGTLVEQFYGEVLWEELDFLLIDMPPGTGDVALTIFQKLPVDDLVLVASPQGLVSLIVEKAARMADEMSVPIAALVTNMSYVLCPRCGEKIEIYGADRSREVAARHSIALQGSLPFDARVAAAVEAGEIEELEVDYLDAVAAGLAASLR